MPIVAPELPSDALDAIRSGLLASGRFPQRRGGTLSLSLPHQVFTAGLEPLAKGERLTDVAQFTAWRALLEEDNEVIAAAEVPVSTRESPGASINRGALAQSTVEGVETAERHERVASEPFELRLLRIPALYASALWLHRPDANGDIFIALAPAPPPLTAQATYDAGQFGTDLQGMAQSVLSAYKTADRPDELGS